MLTKQTAGTVSVVLLFMFASVYLVQRCRLLHWKNVFLIMFYCNNIVAVCDISNLTTTDEIAYVPYSANIVQTTITILLISVRIG